MKVDQVRGTLQGEEYQGPDSKDHRALSQERTAMRLLVLMRSWRSGEEDEHVEQEQTGDRGQVEEEGGGFTVTEDMLLGEAIDGDDYIDGDDEDTVGTGEALDQALTKLLSRIVIVTFVHFICESFLHF